MRRIAAFGLIGWAGIVGLSWYLANERLHHCYNWQFDDSPCIMRALAARDSTLVYGLSIGLAVAIVLATLAWLGATVRARREIGEPWNAGAQIDPTRNRNIWQPAARVFSLRLRRFGWPILAGSATLCALLAVAVAHSRAGWTTGSMQNDLSRQVAIDAASDAAAEAAAGDGGERADTRGEAPPVENTGVSEVLAGF